MVSPPWEDTATPRVFIATPSKGSVDMSWALTFGQILRNSPVLFVTESNSAPAIDYARNELVEHFLLTSCEWMLWLDSDVIPPIDVIARLLKHQLPIVSGLYRARNVAFASQGAWPIVAGMFAKNEKGEETGTVNEIASWSPGEVLRVDAVGMGCVLVARKVFTALEPPWFDFSLKYKWLGEEKYARERLVSEDWYFFQKVKKAGIPVYLDTTTVCTHQTLANIGYDGKVYAGGLK